MWPLGVDLLVQCGLDFAAHCGLDKNLLFFGKVPMGAKGHGGQTRTLRAAGLNESQRQRCPTLTVWSRAAAVHAASLIQDKRALEKGPEAVVAETGKYQPSAAEGSAREGHLWERQF